VALADIAGDIKPDITIREGTQKDFKAKALWAEQDQGRIYIEVKLTSGHTHDKHMNQYARYLLYLMATSLQARHEDRIARALVLAAPTKWFDGGHGEVWHDLVERWAAAANELGVSLCEIHLADDLASFKRQLAGIWTGETANWVASQVF
jgi:hypothetical protein